MSRDILECYKIFDLPAGSSPRAIRDAYIELCRVWDPRRHGDNPILRRETEQKREAIEDAYVTFQSFLPELSAQGEATQVLDAGDIIRQKLEWDEVDDHWSLRRIMTIALISAALMAIFIGGAVCIQRLVASGYLKI